MMSVIYGIQGEVFGMRKVHDTHYMAFKKKLNQQRCGVGG
jgi:hypothetical protein